LVRCDRRRAVRVAAGDRAQVAIIAPGLQSGSYGVGNGFQDRVRSRWACSPIWRQDSSSGRDLRDRIGSVELRPVGTGGAGTQSASMPPNAQPAMLAAGFATGRSGSSRAVVFRT
jgi:hypothetical protein